MRGDEIVLTVAAPSDGVVDRCSTQHSDLRQCSRALIACNDGPGIGAGGAGLLDLDCQTWQALVGQRSMLL